MGPPTIRTRTVAYILGAWTTPTDAERIHSSCRMRPPSCRLKSAQIEIGDGVSRLAYESHTGCLTLPATKIGALQQMLDDRPEARETATAKEGLSLTEQRWDIALNVRAGRYFMWQPLRLAELHNHNANGHSGTQLARLEEDLSSKRRTVLEMGVTAQVVGAGQRSRLI